MASIVVADDEPKTRNALEFILRQAGYAVCTAASGYEALAHLRHLEADNKIARLTGADGVIRFQAVT